ncbi:disease resistance protein At4g27190-like [Malus sylvestris]|uniref:disease resistance protein At4g27190-like n=1 Tax=Malus sylvestris TaxID=3752 RepID=UPI0021ACFA3B|nr:disease resistance protein At4g27190-like [Malus sylvestris]XP_050109741.1 disease resistance protein At4g27190-like [Malus sylvestris]
MEFLFAFVPGIVGKLFELTVQPVGRQAGYIFHHKRNLKNLESQLENLGTSRNQVQHTVNEVKRKGRNVDIDVEKWLTRVDEITAEAKELLKDEQAAKARCLHGWCPNLFLRYQLSKKTKKMVQGVLQLHVNKEFPRFSFRAPPQEIWSIPTEEYEAFESRAATVKKIMEELRNPNTNMIGVYGIGGVGKTTLIKEVFRQATKEELFDDVVLVLDVKQNPDLERIQKEIAEKLGLDVLENQTIAGRARILCDRLRDTEILVILDDVWERIDLEALGLPRRVCKILLTCRSREILSSEMRTQKEFGLHVLGEEETWSLFEKMAGDAVKDPAIRTVATEVAQKCGGLPVLVVTVASALRNRRTLHAWKDALRRLKRFGKEELTEKVYSALGWSYDQLGDEELKPLFLLCGITGRNYIFLGDLLKYCIGLGLFKNINTVEEARNALHSLVEKLKDACLLLDGYDNTSVRMHDLVRDVAISIAFRDKHILSAAYGDELKEWPDEGFLKNCSMISFPCCNIPTLPEALKCGELKMFFLWSNDDSFEIPERFFEEVKELKVLDLTNLRIPSLPPSLQFLTSLQTLCLDLCVLGDIALLGQLRNLEILSLLESQVKKLPKEIGQLSRLRLLDLSGCSEIEVISPGVISSLERLEDLRMGNSFNQWEEEGVNVERSNASLSELKHLSRLSSLDIHIPDANILPENLFSDKLERYHILVGDAWKWHGVDETFNTLKLKLTASNQLDGGLKMLLKRSEDLYFDVLEGVNNIVYHLDSEGLFQQLKHLHVQNNAETTYIINSVNWSYAHNAFPILESLFLDNLVSLESVCYGQLTAESFRQLRIIKVESCHKLRNLFSFSVARCFLQLQEIEVENCETMREIVAEEREDNFSDEAVDPLVFFQLRSLTFQCLPNLIGFSSKGSKPVVTAGLDEQLTNGEFNIIILENEIGRPVQQFMNGQVVFPSLTSLIVDQCDGLRFMFSSSMARSLEQLKYLQISRCHLMEEIVSTHEPGEENADNMFRKLEHLHLEDLPNLARFCAGSYIEFPSLERLDLRYCPKLGAFISNNMSKEITNSKEIEGKGSKDNFQTDKPSFLTKGRII